MAEAEKLQMRDTRRPGHFWADNEVLDVYGPQIGAYGFAVYLALCRFANNRTGRCFPSQRTLGTLLGVSASTVKRSLTLIVKAGLIAVDREGRGPNATNIYTVLTIPRGLSGNDGQGESRCWYCGIESSNIHEDHQTPKSHGGSEDASNKVLACNSCNQIKRDLTVEQFRKFFPDGHKFYGEIGSIGTLLSGTNGSIGMDPVGIDSVSSVMGSQGATNNTNNKTQEKQNQKPDMSDLISQKIDELVLWTWGEYIRISHRNPKTYTLTETRRHKCKTRVIELLKIYPNDFRTIAAQLRYAMERLLESEFHREKGFIEWDKHLFRSQEQLGRWINTSSKGGPNKPEKKSPWQKVQSQASGA